MHILLCAKAARQCLECSVPSNPRGVPSALLGVIPITVIGPAAIGSLPCAGIVTVGALDGHNGPYYYSAARASHWNGSAVATLPHLLKDDHG